MGRQRPALRPRCRATRPEAAFNNTKCSHSRIWRIVSISHGELHHGADREVCGSAFWWKGFQAYSFCTLEGRPTARLLHHDSADSTTIGWGCRHCIRGDTFRSPQPRHSSTGESYSRCRARKESIDKFLFSESMPGYSHSALSFHNKASPLLSTESAVMSCLPAGSWMSHVFGFMGRANSGSWRRTSWGLMAIRPQIISASAYKRWSRELAISHLIPHLARYADRPNPVGQFYFWNRTRRHIAGGPWGIMNGACHAFAPYLSKDVYEFLAALPAAFVLEYSFHTETIANFYPEHAQLRYEPNRYEPNRNEAKGNAEARSDWLSIADHAWMQYDTAFLRERAANLSIDRSFYRELLRGSSTWRMERICHTVQEGDLSHSTGKDISQVHELPRRAYD